MHKRTRTIVLSALLIFILFIGVAPRAIEVLSHNYIFEFDQGLFFQKVKSIVVDHKFTLIGEEVGGGGGFFQGPGFYYLLSIPFWLTHGDPYGAMVGMFVLGVSTMILAWYVTYRNFSLTDSVFVFLLFAISPVLVTQSRFIWNPFAIPIITLSVLSCLYHVIGGRPRFLWALFVIIGLAFHFEIATGIMMFVQYSLLTAWLIWKKIISWRHALIAYILFGASQLHFVLFDLRHNFLISRGVMRIITGQMARSSSDTAGAIMANHLDVFRRSFVFAFPYGTATAVLWIAILLGVCWLYLRDSKVKFENKLFTKLLLLSPVVTFVLYMKYNKPMWDWWILDLTTQYVLLAGLLLGYLWRKGMAVKLLVLILCSVLVYKHGEDTYNFYKRDFSDYGGTHKIRGKIDALDYIYDDAHGAPFNLFVFTPPVYTYPYDYLLLWHSKPKYGYLPGNEKIGKVYMLIDVDQTKPWSYQGWKETVIKPGGEVQSITLSSGFIVEKSVE